VPRSFEVWRIGAYPPETPLSPSGSISLGRTSGNEQAEAFSHARMVLRRGPRKEAVLAGFAAKAQAPMMVRYKTKLSPTICASVFVWMDDHTN
jgi:hypothetical protein